MNEKKIAYLCGKISGMRIVSEKLCLDHTFLMGAIEPGRTVSYEDIIYLQNSQMIDKFLVCFSCNGLCTADFDEEGHPVALHSIPGWQDMSKYELRKFDELQKLRKPGFPFETDFEDDKTYL